jgi:hypothetical protein
VVVCAFGLLERSRRTLQRRRFTSAARRGDWLQRPEKLPCCEGQKKFDPVSRRSCGASGDRVACHPKLRRSAGWRSAEESNPYGFPSTVFKTAGAPLHLNAPIGDLPQIRTAYLRIGGNRSAPMSQELGDRCLRPRLRLGAQCWSGCGVSKSGLPLPRRVLFRTSFTLMNGDRCGERSRLTSWTVTLPHLMHKRPWCVWGDLNTH